MSGMRMSTRATSNGRARERGERLGAARDRRRRCGPCCAQARSSTQRIDSSSSATRMVPGQAGSGVAMVLTDGKRDAEARAAALARLVGDDAAVLARRCGGRPRGRARCRAALVVKKGEKSALWASSGTPGPSSAIGHRQELVAIASVGGRGSASRCASRRCSSALAAERLDRVLHQVEKHLGQLRAVAEHRRAGSGRTRCADGRPPVGRCALQRQHVVQDAVDVLRPDAGGAAVCRGSSSCSTRPSSRSTSRMMTSVAWTCAGSVRPARRSCAAPLMPPSGFRISCARPSATVPSAQGGRRAAWSRRARAPGSGRGARAPRRAARPARRAIGAHAALTANLVLRGRGGDPRPGGAPALRAASPCARSASHALVGRPSKSCSRRSPTPCEARDTGQLLRRRD